MDKCPMCSLEVDNDMGYCYNCGEYVEPDPEIIEEDGEWIPIDATMVEWHKG